MRSSSTSNENELFSQDHKIISAQYRRDGSMDSSKERDRFTGLTSTDKFRNETFKIGSFPRARVTDFYTKRILMSPELNNSCVV